MEGFESAAARAGPVWGEVVRERVTSTGVRTRNAGGGEEDGDRVIERVIGARESDVRGSIAEASAEALFSRAELRLPCMAVRR